MKLRDTQRARNLFRNSVAKWLVKKEPLSRFL